MTKLQTIIEYAVERGYPPFAGKIYEHEAGATLVTGGIATPLYYERIIFNHDFLKAVFGEGEDGVVLNTGVKFKYFGGEEERPDHWKNHAQQMVISEDPVDYVYNYIEEQDND